MKNKHLVMYESNPTGMKSIKKLLDEGVSITFLTSDKYWYINGIPGIESVFNQMNIIEDVDIYDVEVVYSYLEKLNASDPIHGIISFSEFHIVNVAKLCERFNLPTVSSKAVVLSRNKDLTRVHLKSKGLPQPSFLIANSDDEVRSCVEEIGFPCIIKIADGTAGQYVSCVHDEGEVNDFLEEIKEEDLTRGRGITRNHTILIESYAEGDVISLESIVSKEGEIHLLGIHDRVMVGYPRFIEMGFEYSNTHPLRDELQILNENVIRALGIDLGCVHIEYIITSNGPVVLEVNCRLAGCFLPDLMMISSGVDPQLDAVRIALGINAELSLASEKTVLGRYFGVDYQGTFASIDLKKANESKGVVEVVCNILPGKKVRPVEKFNYDVIGYVIAEGNNSEAAKDNVINAISNINIMLNVSAVA